MALEDAKRIRERRKYFSGIATRTVVNFMLYNKSLTPEEKNKVLKIAQRIAESRGYYRVTWDDFCLALKKVKSEKGLVNSLNHQSSVNSSPSEKVK